MSCRVLQLFLIALLFIQCEKASKITIEEINSHKELKAEDNIDSLIVNYGKFKENFPDSKYLLSYQTENDIDTRIFKYCLEKNSLILWEQALPVLDYVPATMKNDIVKGRQIYNRLEKNESTLDIIRYIDSLQLEGRHSLTYFHTTFAELKSLYEDIQKKEEGKWKNEKTAWKLVNQLNTIEACRKYLDNHPNGRHKKEVIDKEVQLTLEGEYGNLPSMNPTKGTISSKSTIKISNSTPYALTVLYSGTSSERIVIASEKSKSVKLKSGTYKISASVNNPRVRNFAGTEVINMSDYNVEYYIQTSRY